MAKKMSIEDQIDKVEESVLDLVSMRFSLGEIMNYQLIERVTCLFSTIRAAAARDELDEEGQ